MKYCSDCKTWKPKSEFHKNKVKKGGLATICKRCTRDRHSKYWKDNKEQLSRKRRITRIRRWKRAVSGYGGKCLFCGEDRPEALVFHRVNGHGKEHRDAAGGTTENGFYKWLVDNDFPDDIVLLCANCHLILHRTEDNK